MAVAFSARIVANESVLINEFSDGASVLLNLETEHYFDLNESGNVMWKRLTSEESIEAAYGALLEEFDGVEPEELRRDLAELVEELIEHTLVRVEGSVGDG